MSQVCEQPGRIRRASLETDFFFLPIPSKYMYFEMSVTTHVRCLTVPSHPCPQEFILFYYFLWNSPHGRSLFHCSSCLQCRFLVELYLLLMIQQFIVCQPPKPQSTLQMHNEGTQPTRLCTEISHQTYKKLPSKRESFCLCGPLRSFGLASVPWWRLQTSDWDSNLQWHNLTSGKAEHLDLISANDLPGGISLLLSVLPNKMDGK